ncbi:MAG: succinate dehydrogenase hydrophobic membrane anchor subunit [Micrococcales bacterium]|nr:succinate dehydrogenase hydrophobic membrane anchor subunit [Micrococcales bacterium]MCL2666215.1 succinate dehydrogenase hydrophobic membrane anchor subunit [Micrococcales bacterium]
MTAIADPKAPRTRSNGPGRRATRTNAEAAAWMFMRVSGITLVVLLAVHLTSNLIVPEQGVRSLDFAFVAGKWSSFGWQLWDLAILWLAMIHGGNGLRTIINDYAHNNVVRLWCKVLVAVAFGAVVLLGTLVIFTFDPCPAINGVVRPGSPSFCFAH